jgi:hypothetical protein
VDTKPFNREAAKQQPEIWFATPMDIVGHRLLTRGEKIVTLERWRLNLLGELAAANARSRKPGPVCAIRLTECLARLTA